jgi:hypothetical protein
MAPYSSLAQLNSSAFVHNKDILFEDFLKDQKEKSPEMKLIQGTQELTIKSR